MAPHRTRDMASDNQFFVETVLSERAIGGTTEYLCKWEGYPATEATWVGEDDVNDDLIYGWQAEQQMLQELDQTVDDLGDDASEVDAPGSVEGDLPGIDQDGDVEMGGEVEMVDAREQKAASEVSPSCAAPAVTTDDDEGMLDAPSDPIDEEEDEVLQACPGPVVHKQKTNQPNTETSFCSDPSKKNCLASACTMYFGASVTTAKENDKRACVDDAVFALCETCADLHLNTEDPRLHKECRCLINPHCSACFAVEVLKLGEASLEGSFETDNRKLCFRCLEVLEEEPEVLKCAHCQGLKVRY